jgi:hypothetical protein
MGGKFFYCFRKQRKKLYKIRMLGFCNFKNKKGVNFKIIKFIKKA